MTAKKLTRTSFSVVVGLIIILTRVCNLDKPNASIRRIPRELHHKYIKVVNISISHKRPVKS